MKPIHIALVLGARPQIIKSARLIKLASQDEQLVLSIIHTGQHYDYEMTKVFFEEFSLPEPSVNLGIGSASHAQQTSKILSSLEPVLLAQKPDLVLVPGDTNSTLAAALTAAKLNIPVAHFEAGARSYDLKMPEEINRCLTDHCSTLLFTATKNCSKNLIREGIRSEHIYQVGDTMYDVFLQQLPKVEQTQIFNKLNLPKKYVLLTLHRQENVDAPQTLHNIMSALFQLNEIEVVFPVHPRTYKQLCKWGLHEKVKEQRHILTIKPVSYLENIALLKNANLVLTDSGGIQKEAFWLRTPCITLREKTEWVETIQNGVNYLVGSETEKIVRKVREILNGNDKIRKRFKRLRNPFGTGKASQLIIDTIKQTSH
jgi:UDP-N-acetylglucosamine 2-epimerase (non-hydrolysing)